MAYRTDGSPHTSGVQNEENLINKLQSEAKTLYPELSDSFEVVKRGGTKFKQDLEIVDGDNAILISAKKKVKIKSGSFDWVNSSSATASVDALKSFSETVKSISTSGASISSARTMVNNAGLKALQELTPDQLTTMLQEHVSDKNEDMRVIISETSTGNNWEYNFVDSPLYNSIQNHSPKLKMGRGKTSAKIVFDDDNGNTLDHGIRIRVVTNNGIKALMGESTSNTSSVGVVKIQQDNIPGLISGLGDKIRKF